jgi:hypothetical protein
MSFTEFLKQHSALSAENLSQPKLAEWVKKYLEVYPLEQQEKDFLDKMARERWYDADQVMEELTARNAD